MNYLNRKLLLLGLVFSLLLGMNSCLAVDVTTIPAFHYAAYDGNLTELKFWANIRDIELKDHQERTPLHLAIYGKQIEAVKYLLSKGADIESVDYAFWTPLYYAAYSGDVDIIEYLIAKKVNISGSEKAITSPLSIAIKRKHNSAVKLLINNGADVKSKWFRGFTSLYRSSDSLEITLLLIKYGANVNAVTDRYVHNDDSISYEQTVLHRAIFHQNIDVVKALLENGADVSINHGDGRTTLQVAKDTGNSEIIDFIEKKHTSK